MWMHLSCLSLSGNSLGSLVTAHQHFKWRTGVVFLLTSYTCKAKAHE